MKQSLKKFFTKTRLAKFQRSGERPEEKIKRILMGKKTEHEGRERSNSPDPTATSPAKKRARIEDNNDNQDTTRKDSNCSNGKVENHQEEKHENESKSNPGHRLYRPGAYLAPMVRIGTLPTRLLALEYGAELVWGPEIVDKAIIGSTRIVDETSGTIQYTKNSGTSSIWQTHPIEKSRLIYQIGSANKDLALEAAKVVAQDVSGIDLNCGCPKDFSLKGGMGAALLKEPEKLCGILRHLVENLPTHPISVKIRLLPSQEDTIELIKKISLTGVSCLTVHCRTQTMRSSEPALTFRLKEIVDCVNSIRTDVPLPVVANGDCFNINDIPKFSQLTGVHRVMIARGAERNVSCFRKRGPLDLPSIVMPLYIQIGLITKQAYPNAKYCLSTMEVKAKPKPKQPINQESNEDNDNHVSLNPKQLKIQIQQSKDWTSICNLFNINHQETINNTPLVSLFSNLPPLPQSNSCS